jgi:4,5-DOPA dioxygenase extradiol
MPAVFVGHGNPMNACERNRYTEAWRQFAESLPRPRAIVAVSAHWYTPGIRVTVAAQPVTIHDFAGFPRKLFEFRYPAPGDPQLAERIRGLLSPAAVDPDHRWGLDHGTWSVLAHMFPHADVPVVQLSIDAGAAPAAHYEIGARLAPLRDEGVLVFASGNVVHNLMTIQWTAEAPAYDWAMRFNDNVRERLLAHDQERLVDYPSFGEDALRSVPTPEHYLPLLYAFATRGADDTVSLPVDGIEHGSIGMLMVTIGAPAGA